MAFDLCWWTSRSQHRRQSDTARYVWMAICINSIPNGASHHRRAGIHRMWRPEAQSQRIYQITNNIALWLHSDICELKMLFYLENEEWKIMKVRPLTWHRWTAIQWIIWRIAFRRPATTSNSDTVRARGTRSGCRARCATNIYCMWHRNDQPPRTVMFPPNMSLQSPSVRPQPNTVASICERIWIYFVKTWTELFILCFPPVLPNVPMH